MKTLISLSSICFCFTVFAQNPLKYLDINQVKAGMYNRGDMHWNLNTGKPSYEVPVGGGIHSDFASGLWIGGYDSNNQLHIAAQTYRQNGVDFWPGPLDTTNAAINSTVSNQYDKIWKLNQTDINAFITNFNNGNMQNGSYTPVADLLSWPAQGTGAQTKNMAPFEDVNHNHIYDPLVGGDYPIIKGDQTLYFIFNDNLSAHQASGGLPLKLEIHATAYAYGNSALASQNSFLSKATFYNYKIINRSNTNYHDVFTTLWTDVDLGYYGDDYIGCDVGGNYGYAYNADAMDESIAGTAGYGAVSPAAGYQVLRGPLMPNDGIDNNNNGVVDEPCEQQLMSRFNYFYDVNCMNFGTKPPQSALEYYQYMTGSWRDNTPFTCGGNGYGGTVPTPFMYPGTTYTNGACGSSNFSETGVAGDRRYMISVGPFNLNSHDVQEIEFVHCTSFDYTATNNPRAKLKMEMGFLKVFSDNNNPPNCTAISVKEIDENLHFNLFPNPATNQIVISFNQKEYTTTNISVIDVFGKEVLVKNSKNLDEIVLNVNELAQGIYFAKVTIDGKCNIKKFVKE